MKPGDGTTGNGDEQVREKSPGDDRPASSDKTCKSRHFQSWRNNDDPDGQHGDHPEFHDGAEVIAGRQQQPNRQYRGKESIPRKQQG